MPSTLEMVDVSRRFGAVQALDSVSFDVRRGEVHALLGENGAGKSTLMQVLGGLLQPDSGHMLKEGQRLALRNAADARRAGIALVQQHFALVPAFTVEENLALPAAVRSGWPFRSRLVAAPALERASALGWPLDALARVSGLSVGVQQRIEIVKALASDPQFLVLDEPTAVLSGAEVHQLMQVLRALRSSGVGIVLIAHRLPEVTSIADRITVLRAGRRVATMAATATSEAELASMMVGELPPVAPLPIDPCPPLPVLAAAGVEVLSSGRLALAGLSFQASAGETVGFGGVDGNGQVELAEALTGMRPLSSGSISWKGRPFNPGTSPRTAYIPADRRSEGLATGMSVRDNLLLRAIMDPQMAAGPVLRRRRLQSLAADLYRQFDIRAASLSSPASSLSGGNQQKIVVARELSTRPELIVAVNPTRGLDLRATRYVHARLRDAARNGAVVILFSSDLDELAALSTRGYILSGGRSEPCDFAAANAERIGMLLGGAADGEIAH